MSTPVVLSWSGGKDSALALAALRADPQYVVAALLTTISAVDDRVPMHGIPRDVIQAQASAVGVPVTFAMLPLNASNRVYEAVILDALDIVKADVPDVRDLAFGDLFLRDIRQYREAMCGRMGMQPLFPLWGQNTADLARAFIAAGFRAHLACVDTTQLPPVFLSHAFDEDLLIDLPASADPCGENGEFHTLAFDGPIFSSPVPVRLGQHYMPSSRFIYRDVRLAAPDSSTAS